MDTDSSSIKDSFFKNQTDSVLNKGPILGCRFVCYFECWEKRSGPRWAPRLADQRVQSKVLIHRKVSLNLDRIKKNCGVHLRGAWYLGC